MYSESKPSADAAGLRVGIAVSRYHARITDALQQAAIEQFTAAGGEEDDLTVVAAPGAFELTAICRAIAAGGGVDAVVALGCVIAGETTHDQHIASAVAQGLTQVTIETGVPVAFGVLTCQTMTQACARAGGEKGNKGAEAMTAAIETVRAVRGLAGGEQRHVLQRPRGTEGGP